MKSKSASANRRATARRRILASLATLATLAAGAAVTACAAAAPYNPDYLAGAQLGAVDQICQSVLGLSPAEGSTGAMMLPANPHLVAGTTHYQGCVASLSDSLQAAGASQLAAQAHANCRAQGLASGSGALALCVLRDMQTGSPVKSAALQPAVGKADAAPRAEGPFFYASASQTVRREQLACASLGLEPPSDAFERCVRGLRSTFFAIDNPVE